MSKYTMYLIMFLTVFLALAGLVWLAMRGNLIAIIIVTVLGACGLMSIGQVFEIIRKRQEQAGFWLNAKENIATILAIQNVQNKQNEAITRQLGQVARLPQPTPGVSLDEVFPVEEGIYTELGE
jgi:hypothetical protein